MVAAPTHPPTGPSGGRAGVRSPPGRGGGGSGNPVRSSCPCPAPSPVTPAAQAVFERLPDVRYDVGRQLRYPAPLELIAFMRLHYPGLPFPFVGAEKEIHPLPVRSVPMHDVRERHILRAHLDVYLFLGLPNHGCRKRFPAVRMAGRQAVIPVLVAGVEPSEQKDLPVFDKEKIDRRHHLESLGIIHAKRAVRPILGNYTRPAELVAIPVFSAYFRYSRSNNVIFHDEPYLVGRSHDRLRVPAGLPSPRGGRSPRL